jgi:D-alanyl-lipoteichoic acid acyltransferase DltB (MBOAT superfamily)
MVVPSVQFLLFAAVAAAVFNVWSARWWRAAVLLAANLAFLATFVRDPAELIPYAGFLAGGYALIAWLQRGAPRPVLVVAIALVLAAFFWLKKYTFLPPQLFLTQPYLTVGLSYVFFRVLHLVIDSRDVETVGRVGPLAYLNYTLNFTSLVSGPIQRYDDYRRQTEQARVALDLIAMGEAVERIIVGLFKVIVVSFVLSVWQKQLLGQVLSAESLAGRIRDGALLAALFPVYLFFNFSGYTDFVIGVARFFRLRLPENFDRPFASASFIEYWSRWHMTLSEWLKTYVYNPLVMVLIRRVKSPTFAPYIGVLGLFVTFFLIGAWHGRTSVFLFFGVLNGLGVAVNQFYRIYVGKRMGRKAFAALGRNPWYRAFSRGLTFTWLAFTLLWFWSDWGELGRIAAAMGPLGVAAGWAAIFLVSTAVLEAMEAGRERLLAVSADGAPVLLSRYVRTVWLTVLVLVILGVQTVMNAPAADIVYKEF